MRKLCENKDADQLRGNREADQRLCFRYMDSTIQCSRKLPTLYRTFGQTEYESLSDRQKFCLTEKQSGWFGKIIKGRVCEGGSWGGGVGFFFLINFL